MEMSAVRSEALPSMGTLKQHSDVGSLARLANERFSKVIGEHEQEPCMCVQHATQAAGIQPLDSRIIWTQTE